jgi:hypothetical protein
MNDGSFQQKNDYMSRITSGRAGLYAHDWQALHMVDPRDQATAESSPAKRTFADRFVAESAFQTAVPMLV